MWGLQNHKVDVKWRMSQCVCRFQQKITLTQTSDAHVHLVCYIFGHFWSALVQTKTMKICWIFVKKLFLFQGKQHVLLY